MTCDKQCNQGRDCDCPRENDRAIVIVVTLLLIAVVSMGFGVWKLFHATTGQQCAVEVQFKEGIKATYIGTSI
jgi:hypothetical protein